MRRGLRQGLTITEFEDALKERAATYLVDPYVAVEILEYASQKFYVLGEVPSRSLGGGSSSARSATTGRGRRHR